jgi:uncharacterized membrane protein
VSVTASRTPPASSRRAALADRSPRVEPATLVVVGLTAIALLLRLSQIHQSLFGDEVFSYQDIQGRSFGAVLTTVHTGGENSPPVFFLLSWLTAKLGNPTVWLRLPSVVLGAATVPVVYALGRATVGRTAGLIAAAIFAVSPFTVYYGTEARPYATMTFFVALSTLALVNAVQTRDRRWWALYVVAAAAAAYTHYTCIFVLVVQGAWSIWRCRDRMRAPLIANAVAVVLYLPWLPHLRGKDLGVIGYLYPLSAGNVVKDWIRSLVGYVSASLTQIPAAWGLVVIGVCVAAGLVIVARRWWPQRRLDPRSPVLLLIALAVATPVGLLLYSLTVTDLWLPRGLSASVPAATLLIGALLAALPGRARTIAVALVLLTLTIGTFRSFGANYVREPYRAMAAYIDRHAGPRDTIVSVSLIGGPAISAQLHTPRPLVRMTAKTLAAVPRGADAFVVVGDLEARRLGIGTPTAPGMRLVLHKHYPGSLPTEMYVYHRS